jgi:integrase
LEPNAKTIRVKPKKTTRHGISVAIPLLPDVASALEAIRNDGRKGDYCFPVHAAFWGKKGLIGRVLNFRNVLDRAGVTGNYTIHSWRHTAATRLANAGVDIETRMRLLGHTVKDTARLYDHAEHIEETRDALERAAEA